MTTPTTTRNPAPMHRLPILCLVLLAALATAAPAAAAPFCFGGAPGLNLGLSIHLGTPRTAAQQATSDQMALRRIGVDASRVERWNGCLRAFVRQPGGGVRMEFYDPATLRRVY